MRVVVDGNPLYPLSPTLGPTGVGRWARGAIGALAERAPDWKIDLVAFHMSGNPVDVSDMGPNVSFKLFRFSSRLHRKLVLTGLTPPLEWIAGQMDVMLAPAYVTWRCSRAAEIPVIYDLTYIHYPRFVSKRNLYYLKMVMPRVVRRASRIITVSEAMRHEISDHYRIDLDRISVVHGGVDHARFSHPAPIDHLQLPDRYLLFVGTLEPRKNLEGVLDGYALARTLQPDLPSLVVAGGTGWRFGELQGEVGRRGLSDSVKAIGYVDDADLPGLYAAATCLVWPSHYEGFGLPVLEAMASGCPVITSSRGGLPEVVGSDGLIVDPDSVQEIADAISRITNDYALAEKLKRDGKRRADGLTWDRAGASLRNAIEASRSR